MPIHNHNIVNGVPKGLDPGKGHGVSTAQFFKQRDRGGAGGMGIYNGRGPYDVVDKEKWEDYLEGEEDSDFDPDDYLDYESAKSMNRMIGTSGHIDRSYQSMDRKGVTPFSGVPDAGGAGHTALRANHDIKGSLIFEEFLKEYIYEVLNENRGASMSGGHYINKAGHSGKLYPPKNLNPPLSPSSRSFKVGRTTNSRNNSVYKNTASGVGAMNKLHDKETLLTDEEAFNSGEKGFGVYDIYFGEDADIFEDELNVSKYNKNVKV